MPDLIIHPAGVVLQACSGMPGSRGEEGNQVKMGT